MLLPTSSLAEIWAGAVADADLEVARVRLYPVAGAPPGGSTPDAWWWLPSTDMLGTPDTGLTAAQIQDGNSSAARDLHRISVFAGVSALELAATIRHELEHVKQWERWGPECNELSSDVQEAVLYEVGGRRGSGAIYNLVPSERDANAAASRFLRAKVEPDQLARLWATRSALAGWGEGGDEEESTPLPVRLLAFVALFPGHFEHVRSQRSAVQRLDLDNVPEVSEAKWEVLSQSDEIAQRGGEIRQAVPQNTDLDAAAVDQLPEMWRPVRERISAALPAAVAIAQEA